MIFDADKARARWVFCREAKHTIAHLNACVGGLSKPGKMPWYSYSIPAEHCKVGSVLRKVRGSVCSSCYATKGRYVFPNVRAAMERRYRILVEDTSVWAGTMVALLERKARGREQYFRWHDSGDLQGQAHLDAIIWIAQQLPHVHFWLPTKEYQLVEQNKRKLLRPSNLLVRVSAPRVAGTYRTDLTTSTVGAGVGHACPAHLQGNKCGSCRACWSPNIGNVDYELH